MAIISLFPNLSEIALRCCDGFEFLQPDMNHPTIPSLRSLQFSPDGKTSFPLLYHLLSWWLTIQFLDVICSHFYPPPPPQSCRPSLQLTDIHFHGRCTIEFLDWLVPDEKSLRVLCLRTAESTDLKSFFERAGKNLRALELIQFDQWWTPFVSFCPNLEELEVRYLFQRPSDLEILHMIPQWNPKLQCIRIQAFWFNLFESPDPIIVMTRALPMLRVLSMSKDSQDSFARFPTWRDFERELSERGVSVIWTDESRVPVVRCRVSFSLYCS
jgi:hypothetical protein